MKALNIIYIILFYVIPYRHIVLAIVGIVVAIVAIEPNLAVVQLPIALVNIHWVPNILYNIILC